MAAYKSKSKRIAKKSFFQVEAPLTSVGINLYGSSVEEMHEKLIKLDMTKSLRGKSIELRLRVLNESGKLVAVPISAELMGSYIRRAIRPGIDYVEDSFETECRDYIVRIKPFLITRRKVSRAIRRALRNSAKEFIKLYIKVKTAKEIFSDILANKIQKGMAAKLKKIYPLALCEIRVFEIKEKKQANESEREKIKEDFDKEELEIKRES